MLDTNGYDRPGPIVVRAVPDEDYVEPDWHVAIVEQLLPGRGAE